MAAATPSVLPLPVAGEPRRETPTFVFAYANDRHDDARFLRNLAEERRRIKQALQGASDQGRCKLVECSGATVSEVLDECQRHARSLAVLHFAGHADSASLCFETADGQVHTVSATAFTEFLGGIRGLQLVFLNGCSTQAQVEALLSRGIRAVVATSSSVPDEIATELAERFYKAVEGGATIGDAFHQAAGAVRATFGEDAIERARCEVHRGARDIESGNPAEAARAPFPWELFGEPDALAHRLMASRSTGTARCRVVITATLEQFDAAMIARVTEELQRASGDMSLQITSIERGSVRLQVILSQEGARRLIESWERGGLTKLCGFDVAVIEADVRGSGRPLILASGSDTTLVATRDPAASSSLATLGNPAGMLRVHRHTSARWRSFWAGGLAFAGAVATIAVFMSLKGASRLDPVVAGGTDAGLPPVIAGGTDAGLPPADAVVALSPPKDAISVAPKDVMVASRPPKRAMPSPPARAVVTSSPPDAGDTRLRPQRTPAELEAKCRRYEMDRQWTKHEECVDALMALDSRRGRKFKPRAEDEMVDDLAIRLKRVKDSDCEAYNELVAKVRASRSIPAHVITVATRQVPCTKCDADELARKAADELAKNRYAAALKSYDASLTCRPDSALLLKALEVACKNNALAKAKSYWQRLPADLRGEAEARCIRSGTTRPMLDE